MNIWLSAPQFFNTDGLAGWRTDGRTDGKTGRHTGKCGQASRSILETFVANMPKIRVKFSWRRHEGIQSRGIAPTFLNSALDEGEWLNSRPSRFYHRTQPRYQLNRILGVGARAGPVVVREKKNFLHRTGFKLRIVPSVA